MAKSAQVIEESPFKKAPLHKRVSKKIKGNKLKSVATASLATLLIGGFLVYMNLPTINIALAGRAADMSVKVPKGIPSNFALSPKVTSSQGIVTLQYKSRVDDRAFQIIQQKDDMTVDTLKEAIARLSKNQFQTYEASGITLFLGPDDRVDWVDAGVRYSMTGETGFTPDQIATIATSL
jgi:hypothetical protein